LIGLFLILGAVTVFNQSRNTYRASEGVARLQETARLAMDVIESDIRMANYWGMNNRADYIVNRAGPSQPPPAEFNAQQQTNVSLCGTAASNWVINLDEYLGGSNNSYGLQCAASNYQAGTDVVFIRRANEARPLALDPNRVYLQTSRIQGTLFVPNPACTIPTDPNCIPAAYLPPASESRELEARAYYVSSQSTLRNDVPSLRRKRFASVNAAIATNAVLDEEIVSGVEDLQVRLGIDTDGDSNIDQYVEPGGVPGTAAVVSVTVWLRVRAEDRDFGHRDETAYQYADMAAAFTPNDNYRRILVSKTIHIRNSRI
jgi:type IV pilus assembly protein PilW